ncbi:MAG: 1,4-dihydroxy-2-naphthoate octaprenyltransferase [Myxococcales bacterium]
MSAAALAPPAAAPPQAPGRAAVWLRALRLYSVTASVVPVALGVAVAWPLRDRLGLLLFVPAILAGVLLHLGTNLVNDLGDFEKGVDHEGALGGSGVLTGRMLTPRAVGRAAALCFAAAALIGVWLIAERGATLALLGAAGLVGGWGYTAGPRYKYLGLGDAFVFVLMGPLMVLGGAVAVSGRAGFAPALASIPIGLLVTAILHANNVRDLEADQQSGLHTVAIWLGRAASLRYFAALVYGAYAAAIALAATRVLPWASLLPLLTLPLARKVVGDLSAAASLEARRARPLVEQTAQLHLAFGAALIAGTALGLHFSR